MIKLRSYIMSRKANHLKSKALAKYDWQLQCECISKKITLDLTEHLKISLNPTLCATAMQSGTAEIAGWVWTCHVLVAGKNSSTVSVDPLPSEPRTKILPLTFTRPGPSLAIKVEATWIHLSVAALYRWADRLKKLDCCWPEINVFYVKLPWMSCF